MAKRAGIAGLFQEGVHLVAVQLGEFVVGRIEGEVIQAGRVARNVVQLLAGALVHGPMEVPRYFRMLPVLN